MSEATIEIRTPDGSVDGFIYRPDVAGPAPGVLLLTDIGGIRASTRAFAARVSERGYTVLMPNVFYRTDRPPLFTWKPNFTEERTLKRFAELASPLTPDAVERDAAAYAACLTEQAGVSGGKLGVVGYCFTGGVALRIAAAQPERVAAAASFHGGGLCTDAPTSPHLTLPRIAARLYFAHAVQDRSMSQERIDQLGAALAAWGGKYENEIYAGALHGWTQTDASVYDEKQSERAFDKLMELLGKTLR